VALTATIYTIEIDLADNDRGVYESLSLRVARHPSESEEYLVTRILAYALEYTEGIEFSRGISDPEAPTISVRDLTGRLTVWVEIGNPDPARVHKASKASPRVAIYTHKDPKQLVDRLAGARIHRADDVELWAIDRAFIAQVALRLDRRMSFSLSVTDRDLLLSIESDTLTGRLVRQSLA
jgi:uncharacterized protein YaeQ